MTNRLRPCAATHLGRLQSTGLVHREVPAHRSVLIHRQDHLADLGPEVRGLEDEALLTGGGPYLLVGHGGRGPVDPDLDELPLGHIGLAQGLDKGVGGVLDPWRPGAAGDTRRGGGTSP